MKGRPSTISTRTRRACRQGPPLPSVRVSAEASPPKPAGRSCAAGRRRSGAGEVRAGLARAGTRSAAPAGRSESRGRRGSGPRKAGARAILQRIAFFFSRLVCSRASRALGRGGPDYGAGTGPGQVKRGTRRRRRGTPWRGLDVARRGCVQRLFAFSQWRVGRPRSRGGALASPTRRLTAKARRRRFGL